MTSQLFPDAATTLVLYVNGNRVTETLPDPEWTLLSYLRSKLRLTGSKLGCGEGGCGACTVMVSRIQCGVVRHYSANACLVPLCSLHGAAVTTVEGIGSTTTRLHPLQERLAKAHGSQCGFCTPGFVMSAYALLRSQTGPPSMEQLEEALVGNLCRCTGYRPILECLRTFTSDDGRTCGRTNCCRIKGNDTTTVAASNDDDMIMSAVLFDPSTCAPYDPTQELIFPPELKLQPEISNESLVFIGPRVTWYRVASLEHLVAVKHKHPRAKIIVGNTEVGIEVRMKGQLYPVMVSVAGVEEMETMVLESGGLRVGAAVSLTAMEEKLKELIQQLPEHETRVFSAIVEMLRWFAGKQIRNVACLGGNIMTSSPISDLNPILLAAGATLHFTSIANGPRSLVMDGSFFVSYRRCAVDETEVLVAVTLPVTKQDEYLRAFKQARRRDDDIAIVNAAMRVRLEQDTATVADATMAFGGVAATTVTAATSQLIAGRAWNDALLQDVTSSLVQELAVAPSAPGGMAAYRTALMPSFFFKFYLHVRDELNKRQPNVSPALTTCEKELTQLYQQPHHTALHLHQEVPDCQDLIDPVGRPMAHVSAMQQVTGEAVYIDDMPSYSSELFAAVVLTKISRGTILSVDATAATDIKGVHSYISAKDLPGERNVTGPVNTDEEVFVTTEVQCVGQIVGLVLASDRKLAMRAANLVKVTYDTHPKPIVTIEQAIEADSMLPAKTIWKGDVSAGHSAAPHTLEGELRIGGQEHFYLEPNAHLAVPGECGQMELFSATQNPTATQSLVAKALGVSASRVVCRTKRMGGGFGGKESRTITLAVCAAIAANVTGRPVRLVLERHDDMLVTGTRHPFLGRWCVSFTDTSLLKALDMNLYGNMGWSTDLSQGVMDRAAFTSDNAYRCPNVRVTAQLCRTNLPSNTAFRGFGGPQAVLVMEDVMDRISAYLNLDGAKVREVNLYREGDSTHFRQPLEGVTLGRCWRQVLDTAHYEERKEQVQQYNKSHRYRKRGLAAMPVKFGLAYTIVTLNQAGALVMVYKDGSVLLSHGGTEMGQGLHTKMIQIAARSLGVTADLIHVSETSTDKVPNTSPTAASVSSDLNGEATLRACQTLADRLLPYRQREPQAGWQKWVLMAYCDRVQLSATGFYATPGISNFNYDTQEGTPFKYFSYGAAVTEVEIDTLTGDHTVLRTDIVMDVGKSMNPAIDIGQIEGAFAQGQGLVTLEELRYTPSGALLTRGPGAYKLPGVQDIPCEFNVTLLKDAPNTKAVYSSKAVGEPPLLLALSVLSALREAVSATRPATDYFVGRVDRTLRLDSPATAERIRMACQDHITEKVPVATAGSFIPWDVTV